MSFSADYYEILEVNPNASQETISAAYRSLARKYYPDVGGNAEMMRKYKYPPEGQEEALNTVIVQCEMWADEGVA